MQDVSVSLRMLPVKPIFQKCAVFTLQRRGKQVNLNIVGEDIEVDKSILDLVRDPLVHIIRNAVDHGIEMPDKRRAAGRILQVILLSKPMKWKISFYIIDDGGGIDAERLKEKALKLGIISPTIRQTNTSSTDFHPGFSTKEKVTDISGRGVGMDVVK